MAPVSEPVVRPLDPSDPCVIDEPRMGYLECTVQGCLCPAYMDAYNQTNLCANCGHDYDLHS